MADSAPYTPAAPTTSYSSSAVTISWTAPNNAGRLITAYTILIVKSDSTYTTDTTDCDGTNATIIGNLACSIPVSVLEAAPFSLVSGDTVTA